MDDANVGRGAFRYVVVACVLQVFGLCAGIPVLKILFGLDVTKVTGGFGPFELGTTVTILVMNVFVVWHSVLTKGWARSLAAFGLTFLCAFTAEALGVHFGLVFGQYHYPPAMGFQVIGVPVLVALAWEPILYASYCISDFLLPSRFDMSRPLTSRLPRYLVLALVGALATTSWDMMADPFAVGRGWWVWEHGGPYMPEIGNGVPVSNFAGWIQVAFLCQLIYRFFMMETGARARRSLYLTVYGPVVLYLMLFLNAFGLVVVIFGKPVVGLVGCMCMGSFTVLALARLYFLRQAGRLEAECLAGR